MNETFNKPSLWKRILISFLLILITATIFYSCSSIYKVTSYKPRPEDLIGAVYVNSSQDTVLLLDIDDTAVFNTVDDKKNGTYVYEVTENVVSLKNRFQRLTFVCLSVEEIFFQTNNEILYRFFMEEE